MLTLANFRGREKIIITKQNTYLIKKNFNEMKYNSNPKLYNTLFYVRFDHCIQTSNYNCNENLFY